MIRIKIPKALDRVRIFERAKGLAKRRGVRFTGCVANGEFSAPTFGVKGTYETRGDFLEVRITNKPLYIRERDIEKRLRSFFVT